MKHIKTCEKCRSMNSYTSPCNCGAVRSAREIINSSLPEKYFGPYEPSETSEVLPLNFLDRFLDKKGFGAVVFPSSKSTTCDFCGVNENIVREFALVEFKQYLYEAKHRSIIDGETLIALSDFINEKENKK